MGEPVLEASSYDLGKHQHCASWSDLRKCLNGHISLSIYVGIAKPPDNQELVAVCQQKPISGESICWDCGNPWASIAARLLSIGNDAPTAQLSWVNGEEAALSAARIDAPQSDR